MPIVQQRKTVQGKWGDSTPDDMMQWMMDKADALIVKGDDRQAFQKLTLSMAAIHTTTTMSVTQTLYDLAAMPEYIQPLRDEINEALASSGGKFNKSILSKLHLLDSCIKESQRYNPPDFSESSPLSSQLCQFKLPDQRPSAAKSAAASPSQMEPISPPASPSKCPPTPSPRTQNCTQTQNLTATGSPRFEPKAPRTRTGASSLPLRLAACILGTASMRAQAGSLR